MQIYLKSQNASSPSFVDRFLFFLFNLLELHEKCYTEFRNFVSTLFMLIYANAFKITIKCFFAFICLPIFVFLIPSGRTTWNTHNLYTAFWNFVSNIIICGNLCKAIQRHNALRLHLLTDYYFFYFWFHLVELREIHTTSTQNFVPNINFFSFCQPIFIFLFNLVELHEVHRQSTQNFEILV